jgi:metallophosphoesterase (TIGR03767 family)
MSGHPPPLTTDRRLGPGAVLRRGASAPYRAVEIIAGEPHIVRDELSAPDPVPPRGGARPLLSLVHVTDLQLADVQSPTRFEFLNRYFADPRYAKIVPVQRPQEALTAHAVDATLRTLNAVLGPATGMPPQLAVTTGDAIDNAQWNEMQNFLALFDGGLVKPDSGAPGYTGVQSLDWPDDIFWKPDGPGPNGYDIFRREFGFPHYPGLLQRALREFAATGLRVPWLSCFGNHEALHQGVAAVSPALADALVGGKKPLGLPAGFDHDRALEFFTERPETFMGGPVMEVTADPGRRPITRRDFVEAHFHPGSRPFGHGFSEQNRLDGTAYYVHDTPAARLIALDTNCLTGGAAGCVDRDQARWLEARLAEVHSSYRSADGNEVRTGNDDRLVILFSHHGIDTLTNTRHAFAGPADGSAVGSDELLGQLHRFPNVVLWLNGHTHTNAVRPRRDPGNPARGFWEVTTCAIVDWPCQARLVELIDTGGRLSIVCTMVDHDTPVAPRSLESVDGLASLHRELAANVPFGGAESGLSGVTADRNVELRMMPPFPLNRAAGLASRDRGAMPGAAAWLRGRNSAGVAQRCRLAAFSAPTSASLPSSLTCATAVRPSAHSVSSAGVPVTVTTGVRALAVSRMLGVPERVGDGSSDLTNSTPTGALRRISLAILRRCQSASGRPRSISRGCQPGCALRTSS